MQITSFPSGIHFPAPDSRQIRKEDKAEKTRPIRQRTADEKYRQAAQDTAVYKEMLQMARTAGAVRKSKSIGGTLGPVGIHYEESSLEFDTKPLQEQQLKKTAERFAAAQEVAGLQNLVAARAAQRMDSDINSTMGNAIGTTAAKSPTQAAKAAAAAAYAKTATNIYAAPTENMIRLTV